MGGELLHDGCVIPFEIEQRLEACPINQQTALEVGAHQALEELRALKITPDTTRRVVTIK